MALFLKNELTLIIADYFRIHIYIYLIGRRLSVKFGNTVKNKICCCIHAKKRESYIFQIIFSLSFACIITMCF